MYFFYLLRSSVGVQDESRSYFLYTYILFFFYVWPTTCGCFSLSLHFAVPWPGAVTCNRTEAVFCQLGWSVYVVEMLTLDLPPPAIIAQSLLLKQRALNNIFIQALTWSRILELLPGGVCRWCWLVCVWLLSHTAWCTDLTQLHHWLVFFQQK